MSSKSPIEKTDVVESSKYVPNPPAPPRLTITSRPMRKELFEAGQELMRRQYEQEAAWNAYIDEKWRAFKWVSAILLALIVLMCLSMAVTP